MASKAPQSLARHLVSSSRRASSSFAVHATRSFSTSVLRHQKEPPSISNINPNDAESFNKKQHEFRNSLAASRQQADSQSSPSSTPGSRISASASQVSPGESGGTSASGSHTASHPEESREAAEQRAQSNAAAEKKGGAFSKLIYGTEAGRQMDKELEHSFSQMLARGKYVHSIVFHSVKPDKVDEYTQLVGDWYPKVAENPENKVHLVGSYRTEVGDCDTFGMSGHFSKSTSNSDLLTVQCTSGNTKDTMATTTPSTPSGTGQNSQASTAS